ncbi:MAG: alpha/beta hydrolase family protein [Caulobacteraceae bacterium]
MKFHSIYKDPIVKKEELLPDMAFVSINSNNKQMFGVLYTAKGKDPHPTIIILHGFPGVERNLDLAHAFRRAGFNTLVFHYRGAWGSEGCFSFGNVLDDIKAALKFVRSDEASQQYNIDKSNIILIGHSMGGFAALHTAIDDLDIKACVAVAPFDFGIMGGLAKGNSEVMTSLREMFKDSILPLHGATVDDLISEVTANADKWNLVNNAEKLAKRNIMLIGGKRDIVGLPKIHYYPLLNALLSYNASNFKYHLLDSDHSFQDKRILLSEIIENWLEKQISKE